MRTGASTGTSLLAACGLVFAFLVADQAATSMSAGRADPSTTSRIVTDQSGTDQNAGDRLAEAPTTPHGGGADTATAGMVQAGAMVAASTAAAGAVTPDPVTGAPVAAETATSEIATRGITAPETVTANAADPADTAGGAQAAPAATAADDATPDDGAPVIARYRLAAALALADRPAAYPDPRAGMMDVQIAALTDPAVAADAETELALSAAERREIQVRLRLAGHDPKGIDGIFGPATRTALAGWQDETGLAATGYVTGPTLDRLAQATDSAYRAYAAEVARRAKARKLVAAMAVPPARPVEEKGCARNASGEIAYGQTFQCDVQGLGESIGSVTSDLARLLGGGAPETGWQETRAPSRPDDA